MDFGDYFFEIVNLKEEEIDNYIDKRLSELKNTENKVIGFNSDTNMFSGFLDEKIRINMVSVIKERESEIIVKFAGLTVNDKKIYRTLIKEIKSGSTPFRAVLDAVDEYLLLKDSRRDVNMGKYSYIRNNIVYYLTEGTDKTVPIQVFNTLPLAKCGEIAAVAHNMFKFIGLEADYVLQVKPGQNHAYNMIYPIGRERYAIIYDGMRLSTNHPLLFYVDEEQKEKMFSGENIEVNENDMDKAVRILLGAKLISNCLSYKYGISDNNYTEDNASVLSPLSKKQKLIFKI